MLSLIQFSDLFCLADVVIYVPLGFVHYLSDFLHSISIAFFQFDCLCELRICLADYGAYLFKQYPYLGLFYIIDRLRLLIAVLNQTVPGEVVRLIGVTVLRIRTVSAAV